VTDSSVPHADALLAHAGFVRCVARAALRGDAEVDDVVQETWLAALQSAPRRPGALRAWLGGIARRQAANRVRREIASRRRDAVAARPDRAPPAAEVAARVELGRRLVDAVLTLDEPYRQAVLLRYYEDLPPREIARLLDLPVETVRTHVKRGLERLRARLDRSLGDRPGGSPAALAFLLGLSPGHVPASVVGGIGGVIMTKKMLLAAALLLLLLGAGVWIGVERLAGADRAATTTDTARTPVTDAAAEDEAAPTLRGAAVDDASPPARVPADLPPGSLVGRVVRADTRAPVTGVPVYASHQQVYRSWTSTRSDADGRFAFVGLPAGEASVFALGAGWVSDRLWEVSEEGYDPCLVHLPPDPGRDVVLAVVPCAVVEGVVLDADGRPVPGAEVETRTHGLDRRAQGDADPRRIRAGADGVFRCDALLPHRGCDLVARDARHPLTAVRLPDLAPGDANPRVTIRFPPVRWVDVVVRDARTAAPVEGVFLAARWVDAPPGQYADGEWHTDAQGRARLGPLPDGLLHLLARSPVYLEPTDPTVVGAGEEGTVEILLDAGVTLAGRVLLPPGLDAENAQVQAEALDPGVRSSAEVPVEADGTFAIAGVAPGRYRVQATLYDSPQWWLGVAEVTAPAGGIAIELAPARSPFYEPPDENADRLTEVALRVLSPDGEPVEQGWVRYFDEVSGYGVDLEEGPARIEVDREGEGVCFEVSDLPAAPDGTSLGAGAYGPLKPVDGVLVLRLEPGAAVRGRVVAPDGKGVAGVGLAVLLEGREVGPNGIDVDPLLEAHTDDDGAFALDGLRRGPYLLKLDVPEAYVDPVAVRATAGGEEMRVRLRPAASVSLRVRDALGRAVANARVRVSPAGVTHPALYETLSEGCTDAVGRVRLTRLVVGETYELVVHPPEPLAEELLFSYDEAWTAADGEVTLVPAAVTTGVVLDRDDLPCAGARVWYRLDPDGERDFVEADAQGRFRIGPTPLGLLRLAARTPEPTGERAPDLLDAPTVATGTREVVLRLRR